MCSYTYNTSCFAFDDEGFQLWSSASASFDINNEWKGKFDEEFRLGNDGGNLYYQHSDVGLTYTGLADWLDLGFNYRYVFEKDSNDKWREENRPHFNVTVKGRPFGLDISDRSRFEYREREIKEDVWRYRNKITVKLPFELPVLKVKPYIADEFFITLIMITLIETDFILDFPSSYQKISKPISFISGNRADQVGSGKILV